MRQNSFVMISKCGFDLRDTVIVAGFYKTIICIRFPCCFLG